MLPLIDEIQLFARDFINNKSFRTSTRKKKIRTAYKQITGEYIKISCNTCYIEALLTIINSKKMSTPNYQLKKGVLLQAFGDASKTCTNDTLTDELAKWYLDTYPDKIIYFERVPSTPVAAPSIKIIPPKIVIIPPAEPAQELLNVVNPPEVPEVKPVVKKTPKKRKNESLRY